MKKLLIIAALAMSSISAQAQSWTIQNDNPCDLEYLVGCYNPETCDVTAAPGTISGYTGYITVASNPATPVSLANPCSSPDVPFWKLRFVGSTGAPGEEIYLSPYQYNPCSNQNFEPWNHGQAFGISGGGCNTSGSFYGSPIPINHIVP